MRALRARSGVRQVTVSARVIRADGRVEELGAVAFWHRNPLRRLGWAMARRRDPVSVHLGV